MHDFFQQISPKANGFVSHLKVNSDKIIPCPDLTNNSNFPAKKFIIDQTFNKNQHIL